MKHKWFKGKEILKYFEAYVRSNYNYFNTLVYFYFIKHMFCLTFLFFKYEKFLAYTECFSKNYLTLKLNNSQMVIDTILEQIVYLVSNFQSSTNPIQKFCKCWR